MGRLDSPHASAEIEAEESEVVCIDTPTKPRCDLLSLLQEVTPPPCQHDIPRAASLLFNEIFISVDEEYVTSGGNAFVELNQHVRDLFLEYKRTDPDDKADGNMQSDEDVCKGFDGSAEKYEKSLPKHGDEMFHIFITRIQTNPGQILRFVFIFHNFINLNQKIVYTTHRWRK